MELEDNGKDTDDDGEYLPDLMPIQSGLRQLLTNQSFKLLEDIAVELKEYAHDKWQHLTVSDLFPDMLHDSKALVAKCTKDELRIIRNVLEMCTSMAFLMPLSQKLGIPTLLQGHFRELILSKKSPSQDLSG